MVAATRSFVLALEDQNTHFTSWVLFNIPPDARALPEAVPAQEQLQSGAVHGKNDRVRIGYEGPCPLRGNLHSYAFTLYALDKLLDLPIGSRFNFVNEAMEGHILARAKLTCTHQR